MPTYDTLRRHANLVDRMANTVGVDLEEKAFRGEITTSEIEDAVLRCSGCTQPGACEHWLDQQNGTADEPPTYCRNTHVFEALRP